MPGDCALSAGRSTLCPEAEYRDGLSDNDFWHFVLLGLRPGEEPEPRDFDPEDIEQHVGSLTPCPECGVVGPCAYDAEGRALIHVMEDDDA